MQILRRAIFLSVLSVSVIQLIACAPTTTRRSSAKTALSPQAATLIHQLDKDAIFYLRLPVLTAGFAPEGRKTDRAYASTTHQQIIETLRTRFKTLSTPFLADAPGIAAILLQDLNGPVEIAVIAPGAMATPAAVLVMRAPLRDLTAASLAQALARGAQTNPEDDPAPVKFDAQGNATLLLSSGLPMAVNFDADTQMLHAQWKMGRNVEIPKVLTQLCHARCVKAPPTLVARAQALDPSGLGAVMVMNIKAFAPYLSVAASDETDPATRTAMQALSEFETIALGAGTINGAGQFSVQVDGFSDRLSNYLPNHPTRLDAPVLGTPSWLASMQLPNKSDVVKLAKLSARLGGGSWPEIKAALDQVGFDVLGFFDIVGPSVHVIGDEGSGIVAIELRDPDAFERYLDSIDQALQTKQSRLMRRVVNTRGQKHTWLWLSGAGAKPTDTENELANSATELKTDAEVGAEAPFNDVQTISAEVQKISDMVAVMQNQRISLGVYRVEGNWLLLSDVPQKLYGRSARKANLQQWLARTQKQDLSHAMLALSGRAEGWASTGYYYYLSSLVALSDVMNVEIPIEEMPSAQELNLPKSGAIGLTVDRLSRGLALRVHYENSPAELMGGGGGGALAMVSTTAILAAIALPAYQDYVVRAETTSALAEAGQAKTEITEQAMSSGEVPESLRLSAQESAKIDSVRFDNHVLAITFSGLAPSQLAGKTLAMTPCVDQDTPELIVDWACASAQCGRGEPLNSDAALMTDIDAKYLPSVCRKR
jgi:hypothetical protein